MLPLLKKVETTSLETFMQSCLRQKSGELVKEEDRKRCAVNLIIYGKDEEVRPNDDDDKKLIKDLITDFQIEIINEQCKGKIRSFDVSNPNLEMTRISHLLKLLIS